MWQFIYTSKGIQKWYHLCFYCKQYQVMVTLGLKQAGGGAKCGHSHAISSLGLTESSHSTSDGGWCCHGITVWPESLLPATTTMTSSTRNWTSWCSRQACLVSKYMRSAERHRCRCRCTGVGLRPHSRVVVRSGGRRWVDFCGGSTGATWGLGVRYALLLNF